MWIVITRALRPEASIWPGCKSPAAIGAVAWPLMWVVAVRHAPAPTGLVGTVVSAIAALSATLGRPRRGTDPARESTSRD